MRATSKGLPLLIGLLLLWAAAGHAFYRIDRNHDADAYRLLAELIEHKAALARAVDGPRVIIAGGSNAYYGLDAEAIQRQIGAPVVNVALPFGAHHPQIALDLLENQVRSGDIVVFSSASVWDPPRPPTRRAREFDAYLDAVGVEGYQRKFSEPAVPWRALPETGPLLLAAADGFDAGHGRSWVEDTDAHGTFTACTDAPVVMPRHFGKDTVDLELAAALRQAATRLEIEGISFLISLPWLYIRESDRERWQAFARHFVGQLQPTVPIVASAPSMLLHSRRSEFCDSPLHLSDDASARRSRLLANALKPYVDRQSGRDGQ